MNKTLLTLISVFILCSVFSCKKKKKDDPKNNPVTTTVVPYGYFYAKMDDVFFLYPDPLNGPDTLQGKGEEVDVLIQSVPGNIKSQSLDAGDIALNGVLLERNASEDDTNAYIDFGIGNPDFFVNGASWIVAGKGTVPAMTYNDTRKQPDYTGPVPFYIDRSKGFTMTFDASNVTNADSVTIAFGVDSNNQFVFSKTFPANVGSATVTAQDMSALSAGNYGIIIMPFTYTIKYFGNNPYAFIRDKSVERSAILQ